MYIDSQALFSNNQAVTSTANSTNVFDLSTGRDLGPFQQNTFGVYVTQAATAAGAATVTVQLVAADDAALTTNVITLMQTDAIGKASLTAGVLLLGGVVPIDRALTAAKRYLGLIYTVATGPLTAGKFTAGLFEDLQASINYPEGLNVSGF